MIMKRLLYALFLLTAVLMQTSEAFSQVYGNEWIDVSRTYYKFKTGKNGIYRIPKSTLDALGVPAAVAGSQFILYRNGLEQALYVSTNSALGSGDYLEFYGEINDASMDRELYSSAAIHANDKRSLFSDSSTYFLTYDNLGGHKRYVNSTTPIPGTPPAPEPYCLATAGNYYKNTFVKGVPASSDPAALQYQFQSSAFTTAEGFVEATLAPGITRILSLATPNAVATGTALFNATLIASSYVNPHPLKIYINNQLVVDTTYGRYETRKFVRSVSPSVLSGNTEVKFATTVPSGAYDLWGVAGFSFQYPRNFDLSGLDYFEFRMPASSASRYLEFPNFNTGSTVPKLFDISGGKWYAGDLSVPGMVRYYIGPSLSENSFVLVNPAGNSYLTLGSGRSVQFKDYTNTANQGNYVIITHNQLMQPVSGQNYIQQYKDYRSSATGGGYSVMVIDVEQLYDQFGYGTSYHPLSVRRFFRYAYNTWSTKPDHAFLIGRGMLYSKLTAYNQSPSTYPFPIVPTYGEPGSDVDFVNFGANNEQLINIGRYSAWDAQQVGTYLSKVKDFETAQQTASLPTAATELWKKRALHIAGATDRELQKNQLLPTLNAGKAIIEDTSFGAIVTTVAKDNTNPVDPVSNAFVDSIINAGSGLITFFGHASSSGFDYNINTPENYTNAPKLPVLTALGCDVAQIFELSTAKTISERYVNAPNGGSIAIIAADNLGFTNFHPSYLYALYNSFSRKDYQQTLGHQARVAYNTVNTQFQSVSDYVFYFAHLESMLLQGDPALRLYARPQPDYHVNNEGLSTFPAAINTSMDSFQINIVSFNLARAIADTVRIKVEHINPSGSITTTKYYELTKLFSSDTTAVWMPLNKVADIGLNKYRVTVDDNNAFAEVSEANNTATLELFIYSESLVPIYPREFGIVKNPNITLKASTLNPFRPVGRYRLEIDTTELFNSSLKQSTLVNSSGGVIKWTPAMTYHDSTVYYWRAAFDSTVNGNYNWGYSSFIHLPLAPDTMDGWNQSHYYQYLKDGFDAISYGADREFRFSPYVQKIKILSKVMFVATLGADVEKNKIQLNGIDIQRSATGTGQRNSLQVLVVDSMTGQNWTNTAASAAVIGCNPPSGGRGINVFEFNIYGATGRNNARKFLLDSIPNGKYIFLKNCIYEPVYIPTSATAWLDDSTIYGSGNTLNHALKSLGFSTIDSLKGKQPLIFACKKGDASFPVYQAIGADSTAELAKEFNLTVLQARGEVRSTNIGPAQQWTGLKWRTSSKDTLGYNDTTRVRVVGIDAGNLETVLLITSNRDTSLAFIDAAQYPRLRMEWESYDTVNRTSAQLDYWRVLYTPVPEAALNPTLYHTFTDSINTGQMIGFATAIENLTPLPMDSMLVRYKVIDANNVTHTIASQRYRKLPGNDTLHAHISFDPAAYPGNNLLFVEANPDNDQPEQYHPNNLGYLPFKVITDNRNPLLDVTFDGVHILDRDIVSPSPFIKIMLKDENQFLALDDTGLLQLYISYPDDFNTRRLVPFDGTTCKFIPASLQNGKKNEAYIEYRPHFTQKASSPDQQNLFTLYVSGKDRSGNKSGKNADYEVSFEVIYESSITRVLNYPNPFSTSTAFVFTLTGSQIPSQFKIQILSVTGKVVREITKQELGDIHIGRNITEYKWDGRDQYGQLLGNGVYLYRVVTTIDGAEMKMFNPSSESDHDGAGAQVNKFFKNGYGKMYIMR